MKWSSDKCPEDREDSKTTISGNSASHTISHLRPGTSYIIYVTASNSAGHISSGNISVETKKASMLSVVTVCVTFFSVLWFKSLYIQLPLPLPLL